MLREPTSPSSAQQQRESYAPREQHGLVRVHTLQWWF